MNSRARSRKTANLTLTQPIIVYRIPVIFRGVNIHSFNVGMQADLHEILTYMRACMAYRT